MPQADVGDLVRDHRRQLALGLRDDHEAGVHRDDAPRPRERVDGRGVDHEEPVAPLRVRARDALSQRVDIVDHLRIVDQSKLAADLAQERFAEPFFLGAGKRLAGRVAEVGKLAVGGGRGQEGQHPRDGERRGDEAQPRRNRSGGGARAPYEREGSEGHGRRIGSGSGSCAGF